MLEFISHPIEKLQGSVTVPGDKSISHRSIMLAAIANGTTHINGFLEGADCLATMNAFKAMGVKIEGPKEGHVIVHGVGLHGLQKPEGIIDLGNSGTSIRLLSGLCSGFAFDTTLTGDSSLQKRPMMRVVKPLRQMGANIDLSNIEFPPLVIHGGSHLKSIKYEMPMASAQVKSCLLLAGLYASGTMEIIEPGITRDHTERMLRGFGVNILSNKNVVTMQAQQSLTAQSIDVPGDISSAAFFIVAASIVPNSEVILKNVGVNPSRIGIIEILKLMGANLTLLNQREVCGEPIADILVKSASLQGIQIPTQLIPLAIDEFPVIFIAASVAKGKTTLRNAKELRVKESDRIKVMADGLKALEVHCEELADGIIIDGNTIDGGVIDAKGDHRIAMAFSIAGLVAKAAIQIKDAENVRTSFPNFIKLANTLGCNIDIK